MGDVFLNYHLNSSIISSSGQEVVRFGILPKENEESVCNGKDLLEQEEKKDLLDTSILSFSEISVVEAVEYFKTSQLPCISSNGQCDRSRVSEVLRWLKSSPKLNENLILELNMVHALMQCSLNWNDKVEWRMLQTIFSSLTKTEGPCPMKGSHWQLIGFQGNDPTTDLRRVGLFGVIQLLHLCTAPELKQFSQSLYSVANSDTQPFPLAVLSLNVTNITLNAMDSGKLIRECNTRNGVIDVLNMYYVSLLLYIYHIWITQKKTIKDSGYLLKDAERYCSKNIKKVLRELPQQIEKFNTETISLQ